MNKTFIVKSMIFFFAFSLSINALCDSSDSNDEAADENRPTITSLDRESAMVGQDVVITGTNFGAVQGTSTVRLNGIDFAVVAWADTEITVTVVAGMVSGIIVVTVNGLPSVSGTEAQLFITEG